MSTTSPAPWSAPPDAAGGRGPSNGVLVAGISVAAVLVLVASVLMGALVARAVHDDRTGLAAVGVPAADAGCDDVVADPGRGISTHVGPGTSFPDPVVDYGVVPPSSGPHLASPVFPPQAFYSTADAPPVEALVHNLEHGYTVLWYDRDLDSAAIDQLREVADLALENPSTAGKFVVTAWDDAHGELPADRPVALSHWTALDGGRRLLCAEVSGEAVRSFVEDFPASDSPEPNGP